jgi:hypothetical protein
MSRCVSWLTFGFTLLLFWCPSGYARNKFEGPSPANYVASPDHADDSPPAASIFKVGGGVSVLSGLPADMGLGFGLGYSYRMSSAVPIYFGMDVGYGRWSAKFEKSSGKDDDKTKIPGVADVSAIQIMASLYYRIAEYANSKTHPYIGVSIGPTLMTSSDDAVKLGDQPLATSGTTAVKLQVLFRPGVEIDLTDRMGLTLEPSLGILNGQLLFAPQVGIAFHL